MGRRQGSSGTPAGCGFGAVSTIITSMTVQPGQCYGGVEDDAPSGSGSSVTVTETNATNLTGIFGQRVSTVTWYYAITPFPPTSSPASRRRAGLHDL